MFSNSRPCLSALLRTLLCALFIQFSAGTAFAQELPVNWQAVLSGNAEKWIHESKYDDDGNVYLYGYYFITLSGYTAIDFDPDTSSLTNDDLNASKRAIFLIKLNPQGKLEWVNTFNASVSEEINGFTIDNNNDLVLSLTFEGTMDIDPDSSSQTIVESQFENGLLIKYDKQQNLLWSKLLYTGKQYTGNRNIIANAVETDSENNIYLTGSYAYLDSVINADTAFPLVDRSQYGLYVSKYNDQGEFLWIKIPEGNLLFSTGTHIKVSNKGYVLAGGEAILDIDWDPGADSVITEHQLTAGEDAWFWCLDLEGNFQWVQYFNSTAHLASVGIADLEVDPFGNYYLDLSYAEPITYPWTNPIYRPDGDLLFGNQLFKLSPMGNIQWAQFNPGYEIAVDSFGVTSIGASQWKHDFNLVDGTDIIPSKAKLDDSYITRITLDGTYLWTKRFGSKMYTAPTSITIGPDQKLLVACKSSQGYGDLGLDADTVITGNATNALEYVVIEFQGSKCINLGLKINTLEELFCTPGKLQFSMFNGSPSATWTLDADSLINDSTGLYYSQGLYSVQYQDDECSVQKDFFVQGNLNMESPYAEIIKTISYPGGLRPASERKINIELLNLSCTPADGSFWISLDTNVSLVSSSITPSKTSADSLFYDFSDFTYTDGKIEINITITTDTNLVDGDKLVFNSDVRLSNIAIDTTANDDSDTIVITTSYDPNQLALSPKGICNPKYIINDRRVEYHVDFQNEGSGEALLVFLETKIDSNLDIRSLNILNASHEVTRVDIEDHLLTFYFENIVLAPKDVNEARSKGFMRFSFNLKPDYHSDTELDQYTSIYFDYNEPVLTNSELRTLVNDYPELDVNVFSSDSGLRVSELDAEYQWYTCHDGLALIEGATGQFLEVETSGSYVVIVSRNGCEDTSECIAFEIGGIPGLTQDKVWIGPNPAKGEIQIKGNESPQVVQVFDLNGRVIHTVIPKSEFVRLDLSHVQSGFYVVEVILDGQSYRKKLLIQH